MEADKQQNIRMISMLYVLSDTADIGRSSPLSADIPTSLPIDIRQSDVRKPPDGIHDTRSSRAVAPHQPPDPSSPAAQISNPMS